ncbi:hypothetical protein OMK64_15280 [Cellulomonas fimi]|uniref:hypothetical protein n=1 Tax=Cellulomonas fimi TaxID=1708 RepID=UPI00234DD726|nr:hypothetical protein [Cellulomonas fimi]MDC7122896.1 hypothetical protein [Cellulomonas fimi]
MSEAEASSASRQRWAGAVVLGWIVVAVVQVGAAYAWLSGAALCRPSGTSVATTGAIALVLVPVAVLLAAAWGALRARSAWTAGWSARLVTLAFLGLVVLVLMSAWQLLSLPAGPAGDLQRLALAVTSAWCAAPVVAVLVTVAVVRRHPAGSGDVRRDARRAALAAGAVYGCAALPALLPWGCVVAA